ncbi:MAG TPA: hypothetical protein VIW94_05485, partial [Acidimicrobiia bacterium]
MAFLAVLGLIVVNNLQPAPVQAEIVAGSERPVSGTEVVVDIVWSFPSTPGQIETATVRVPSTQVEDGFAEVWPDRQDAAGFTTVDPNYQLTPGDYVMALVIGALLGVVMVMTMRGYGYVRGTGEPGSRPKVDVAEDRGFYWRT